MPDFAPALIHLDGMMPHGHCYLWQPLLVGLHGISDLLIGLAYVAISVTLGVLLRRVRNIPFSWVFMAFGIFIVSCGMTHFMEVWTLWTPSYWLAGALKAVTAAASVGTALLLPSLIPKVVAFTQRSGAIQEETSFRQLAEAIPQIVWTARPDGWLDYYNQRWVDYTGMSVAETLGWGWQPVIHPDDLANCLDHWKYAVDTGEIYEVEYRFKRAADGCYRWHLGRALPVCNSAGIIVKWFGTCTDIDDQKRAEAAVKDQQLWLEAILNLMPTPLLLIEPETQAVTFANEAAGHLAGGGIPLGQPPFLFPPGSFWTDPDGNPVAEAAFPGARALDSEGLDGFQIDWHTPAGRTALLCFSKVLPAMFGHPAVAVLTFLDVTRLKHAEDELQQAVRVRDDFLSIASHELKTPLTSLQLQLGHIQRRTQRHTPLDPLPAWAIAKLAVVERQVDRLNMLTTELLDVSRITSGRISLTLAAVDLSAVTAMVADQFADIFENARCALSIDIESGITGIWDAERAAQIVTNLLANAAKYGAGQPVELRLRRDGGSAVLSVQDHGVGIAADRQQQIFGRFERLGSTKHYGGFGLGLWISQQAAVGMGGTITVHSFPDQGATFVVTLPLDPPGTAMPSG
ncbi:MAG: PAS domain-containing sensor histidine kinase [Candidatus Sericytochromatia bacterium]|nr:PAS domain-containing sensor histidine kinase [Candidatus Sericytochromatia bacterium]